MHLIGLSGGDQRLLCRPISGAGYADSYEFGTFRQSDLFPFYIGIVLAVHATVHAP